MSFIKDTLGAEVDELKSCFAGASILTGVLRLVMTEIRPGVAMKDSTVQSLGQLIYSRLISLHGETKQLRFAVPGGLIGVKTKIDLTLCRTDRLVEQVPGLVDNLPQTCTGARPLPTIPELLG